MSSQRLQSLIENILGPREEGKLRRNRALRLHRISALLTELGHPEQSFIAVQVLGTSGKGSCAALLSSILTHAKIPVGLSTKPYLVSPTEHFRLQDKDLPLAKLGPALRFMRPAVRQLEQRLGERLTMFEVLTGLGAALFARARVRVGIFEAGLGGRTDATTALQAPIKIITSIGIDHPASLGNTLAAIARQKAGAIRSGDTVVTTATGAARRIIAKQTALHHGRLVQANRFVGPTLRVSGQGTGFRFQNKGFHTRLIGPHQALNTAAALATVDTLRTLGLTVSETAVRRGLEAVRWPGRFEIVLTKPRLILDGAHNPSKITALVKTLAALHIPRSSVICLFACKTTKDARSMLNILAPYSRMILYPKLTSIEGLISPDDLASIVPGQVARSLPEALKKARTLTRPSDTILLTGSLRLIGAYKRIHS